MQINELLDYTYWAEDHYFKIIMNIDPKFFQMNVLGKNIQQLLYHIYEVYWSWLHTMTDKDYCDFPSEDMSVPELISSIQDFRKKLTKFVAEMKNDDCTRLQWDEDDVPLITPNISILLNYVTHSAYHRGQLSMILHEHGVEEIGETDINPYLYIQAQNTGKDY